MSFTFAFLASVCLVGFGVSGDGHGDEDHGSVYNIISERCCPSDTCYPSQTDMAALNHNMKGHLLLPSFPEYSQHAHMYNTIEQRYPNLIAVVKNAQDIQKAVLFARKHNLHVTIRSSGHDYVGRSTGEGSFNVDLELMDEMEIDLGTGRSPHGTVKVQTGLQWQEIYQKVNDVGRVVVGGSAHTVTPGGYTLGGGHSPVSRSLGYAVDNLLEAQMVLADGSIATATENRTVIVSPEGEVVYHENGDLFWALRGGGGGTFGIAVYFVFRLHPMPSQMVVFNMNVPVEMYDLPGIGYVNLFVDVLKVVEQLMDGMPRTWGGYWLLNNFPGSFENPEANATVHYKGMLTFFLNKFAPWDGSEYTDLAAAVNWAKGSQVPFTFTNKTDFWDYEKDVYDPPITRTYLANTLLQPGHAGEDFREFMWEQMFEDEARDYWLACTGILLGGKTTEGSMKSTPLHPGYRSAVASLACGIALGDAESGTPLFNQTAGNDEMIEYFQTLARGIRDFGSGMYLNEPWKHNPYWKEDFWGTENYERLLDVKRHYDPDNFFTCHHCVGSDVKGPEPEPTVRPPVTGRAFTCLASFSLVSVAYLVSSFLF